MREKGGINQSKKEIVGGLGNLLGKKRVPVGLSEAFSFSFSLVKCDLCDPSIYKGVAHVGN